MIMTGVRAAAALAFLSAPLSFAAAEDAGKLVDQVAPEVSEIASGGHWSADGKGGFYRAFVVMAEKWRHRGNLSAMGLVRRRQAGGREEPAGHGGQRSEAGQRFDHDRRRGRQGDETTIFISSYDIDEDKDISLLVKATNPGNYTMAKAPPEGDAQGEAGPEDGSAGKDEAPGIED